MQKNVGALDAMLRWAIALALMVSSVGLLDRPMLSLGFALLTTAFASTALTRRCPLYHWFGVDSLRGMKPSRRPTDDVVARS